MHHRALRGGWAAQPGVSRGGKHAHRPPSLPLAPRTSPTCSGTASRQDLLALPSAGFTGVHSWAEWGCPLFSGARVRPKPPVCLASITYLASLPGPTCVDLRDAPSPCRASLPCGARHACGVTCVVSNAEVKGCRLQSAGHQFTLSKGSGNSSADTTGGGHAATGGGHAATGIAVPSRT